MFWIRCWTERWTELFTESDYDESELSKLEAKWMHFLSALPLAGETIEKEKQSIQELVSDISPSGKDADRQSSAVRRNLTGTAERRGKRDGRTFVKGDQTAGISYPVSCKDVPA